MRNSVKSFLVFRIHFPDEDPIGKKGFKNNNVMPMIDSLILNYVHS